MIFKYEALDKDNSKKGGTIDAISMDVAISSLQKRGLIISSIKPEEDAGPWYKKDVAFFNSVSVKDVVMVSRQIATLFGAQVSALRVFRLMSTEVESMAMRKILDQVSNDIQGGAYISDALAKHPKIFSPFYTNMVKSGEETGKLDQIFLYLADYLERTFEIISKTKNALIYPIFVVFTFIVVMILMLTLVIPKISEILIQSGKELPIYTQVVLGMSNFFVNYGLVLFFIIVLLSFVGWRFYNTENGKIFFDKLKISLPLIGPLYKRLYLTRISDNMNTLLSSGIPMVRAIELTASVIDNEIYKSILFKTLEEVKAGGSLSDSFSKHDEIPGILTNMVKVGEESGEIGQILKTLANFYTKEVSRTIDSLVGLIEPMMIVGLGLGVGFLLASVLLPIYNVATSI